MFIEELIPEFNLEDKNIEYKGIIGTGLSIKGKKLEIGWLKTLVAFANTDGGQLVIGVENKNHKVVAMDKNTADMNILTIHKLIRERIDPVIDYDIYDIPLKMKNEIRYNHSANGFKKEANETIAYVAYPPRSIAEGVVTAIGHRNYYMQGTQVEVNIFYDRLEITSPGALLGVRKLVKETNIASIIPRRRNEVICNLLEMCKYMEKKGSGFDNIEADYVGMGGKHVPYITADSSSFTLTLPDLTYAKGVVDQGGDSFDVYVEEILPGKNDLKILSYCYGKSRSVKAIANYIGIKPSTYFRKEVLGRLLRDGFLIKRDDSTAVVYMSNRNKVFVN